MKNLSSTPLIILAAAMTVLILMATVPTSEAATCNPLELASCAPAIIGSAAPSPGCCSKLMEQKPCLCGYLKDPNLRQYVNSPGAKRVASTCGVPVPSC